MLTFAKKFRLNNVQLSLLLGLSVTRVRALMNGAKPTEYEHIKIKRLKKVKSFLIKPMSIDEIVLEQEHAIRNCTSKIIHQSKPCYTDETENYMKDLIANAMYLGLLYANNNEDEKVLNEIRKVREV